MDKQRIDEVNAAAMLLGEPCPVLCYVCIGRQQTRGIFGYSRCIWCKGTGFDWLGCETARYMGCEQTEAHKRLDKAVKYLPEHMRGKGIESLLLSREMFNGRG